MTHITECPKCGSSGVGFGNRTSRFDCADCDWVGSPETLMEH